MSRRVVITGAGCVTPLGAEVGEVWRNLTEGRSGIRPIASFDASEFPVRIAAEVQDWSLAAVGLDPAQWTKHPRQTLFAVGAALSAYRTADLEDCAIDRRKVGVYLGCGETFPELDQLGAIIARTMRDGKFDHTEFVRRAFASLDPDRAMNCEPNMPAHCVAALTDAQGPNLNCIAACASSAQAVGNAAEIIARGEAEVMLAGGAHSMLHPLGVTGLYRLGVLTEANDRCERAMRPFDAERDGFVIGEGGAVVVLESLEHAQARKAEIWGELTGYASGHEAYHLTDTHPEGRGLAQCVERAVRQAKLNFEEIDYVNAHGTSTRLNDRIETVALKRALGSAAYRVPVSSTKSMLGHSTTACGAIELIVALMAVRTGVIPPTINYEKADPDCDLDYVPNAARERECRHALSNSLGFGGQTAALLVSRFEESSSSVSFARAA